MYDYLGISRPKDLPKMLDYAGQNANNTLVSADVAELADAQASGACGLTPLEVRLLSSAFFNQFPFQQGYLTETARKGR